VKPLPVTTTAVLPSVLPLEVLMLVTLGTAVVL
jgi:hypothetical protein